PRRAPACEGLRHGPSTFLPNLPWRSIAEFAHQIARLETLRRSHICCRRHREWITGTEPMLQTLPPDHASAADPLPAATEAGLLGVYQLKRAWARQLTRRQGRFDGDRRDFRRDQLVFDALGLGLEQTMQHLGRTAPTFEDFERWIIATTGGVSERQVAR